jgi:hypothetical protein
MADSAAPLQPTQDPLSIHPDRGRGHDRPGKHFVSLPFSFPKTMLHAVAAGRPDRKNRERNRRKRNLSRLPLALPELLLLWCVSKQSPSTSTIFDSSL